MVLRRIVLSITVLLISFGGSAFAAEQGRFGMVLSAPLDGSPGIGVQYHLTPEVSLRPTIAYEHTRDTNKADLLGGIEGTRVESTSELTFSAQLNYYFAEAENAYGYLGIAPYLTRWAFTNQFEGADDDNADFIENGSYFRYGVAPLLGGQVMFHEKFGVYGEAGVDMNFGQIDYNNKDESRFSATTFTSALGVIIYLN